ncbi:MAG: SlyX family protein [Pseudomonadota bacterium]
MTDRLDQIEVRITYLEQANTQLSDTVYSQQQELKALRARMDSLLQRMEAEQAQTTTWTPQDEKPPHY